jgi:2-keto-myo-inositol isomerase
MLIALNGATTMHASLETDIEVAGQAGYDLIEIWGAKLDKYLKQHGPADLAALLRQARVKPYSMNSIEHINLRSAEDFGRIKESCRRLSGIAQAIGCPYVVVVPSPRPEGVSKTAIRDDAVAALNELAEIAAASGVGLAFEMLGPRTCSVNTLRDAWEIVRRVERSNVGLVLDTFHFYVGGSTLSSIMEIDPAKLFIFHINDVEQGDRATLTDAQRLLPGDGAIPLGNICRGLRDIGYKHMVSIELFRPEYWKWHPLRLAREAKLKTQRIIQNVWG